MKLLPSTLLAGAALASSFAALGTAQIQRLDLPQMLEIADDGVAGTIVHREVFRVDHPVDGPEMYFTTLHVHGESLATGLETTVAVTFHGGFIDEENGVYNSEAPSADETRLGRRIVAFYHWTDNMGAGVAANALVAAHGGLYTTFGADDTVVQGRGDGYAILQNLPLQELRARVKAIRQAQGR